MGIILLMNLILLWVTIIYLALRQGIILLTLRKEILLWGLATFVDGDGHRNVIYGFENKVYGLVEGSDSGSGYNTIIGQNNTIGVENSVPLNNVAIIGSQVFCYNR